MTTPAAIKLLLASQRLWACLVVVSEAETIRPPQTPRERPGALLRAGSSIPKGGPDLVQTEAIATC